MFYDMRKSNFVSIFLVILISAFLIILNSLFDSLFFFNIISTVLKQLTKINLKK